MGFSSGVTFQWVSSTVSGGPYSIIPGATGSTYNTLPLTVPTYYKLVVTCVNSALSDSTAELAVSIKNGVSSAITPVGPLAACAGNVATLTAVTTAVTPTYLWKKNGIAIGGAIMSTYIPTSTGSYTVEITDLNDVTSCPGTSNAVLDTVYTLPPVSVSATPSSICLGDSAQLLANVFCFRFGDYAFNGWQFVKRNWFDVTNTSQAYHYTFFELYIFGCHWYFGAISLL
ncbi:MAG: hypothetical protein IPP29_22945 [Bacteroidetes bacterium]|nr:hypothetical protein [Bacteroidota bacterium]